MDIRSFKLTLVCMVCLVILGCGKMVGPKLLSEPESIVLAKQAGLTQVTRVEMETAGPIYRVVFGSDSSGRSKAVWVDDHVIFSVALDEGVSREKALDIAKEKGFSGDTEVQLIYVSSDAKENLHRGLRDTAGDVFWWFRSPEAETRHQIFIDFNTGTVVYEIDIR